MRSPENEVLRERAAMEVYCGGHPLKVLRPWLAARGVVAARDLTSIPPKTRVKVAGMLIMLHSPPTRSGKRVLFITMEDETGLLDLVMFPQAQRPWARAVYTSEVLTVEGVLHREGKDGRSVSVVIRRVLPEMSGSLPTILHRAFEQISAKKTSPKVDPPALQLVLLTP